MRVFINTVMFDSSVIMAGDEIKLKEPTESSNYQTSCDVTVEEVYDDVVIVYTSDDEYFEVKYSEIKSLNG